MFRAFLYIENIFLLKPNVIIARFNPHHSKDPSMRPITYTALTFHPDTAKSVAARIIRIIFGLIVLLLAATHPSFSQQVIVHNNIADNEDGLGPYDDDGKKNGVVVWKSGAVHVTNGNYFVQGPYDFATNTYGRLVLKIEKGAIVKVAGEFLVDATGHVTRWSAGTARIDAINVSSIQIEGATFTDIRDDTEGGDTNQDGTASAPTTTFPSYWFRFGGNPDECIKKNSKIKYAALITHIGSMEISENTFEKFGGILRYYPGSGGYIS